MGLTAPTHIIAMSFQIMHEKVWFHIHLFALESQLQVMKQDRS